MMRIDNLLSGFIIILISSTMHYASIIPQVAYGLQTIKHRSEPLSATQYLNTLNRSSFPPGFVFGVGSSAYQIEGGWNEGGRGPSIWDVFTHKYPEKIKDGSNGDIACDSYHRYQEDVKLLKDMNMDAYRFSISWSRILPKGKLSGGVNPDAIKYYNNLIDELLSNGIRPFVTLFHWDTPQALEEEYRGFLSPNIIKDYVDYAEVCYKAFGDRVNNWITFNEPSSYSIAGYDFGMFAPGRCSSWMKLNCTGGDSSIEPYLVSHHQLLAHAAAVRLYQQTYQRSQGGRIGIALISQWMVPLTNSFADHRASLRALDFKLGWFLDPLVHGDYPRVMRQLVKDRLPKFTKEESLMLKGAFDFIGINYYTSLYTSPLHITQPENLRYGSDALVNHTSERNGIPIGDQAGSHWLNVHPRGIWQLLLYIKSKYNSPPLYVTENGVDEENDESLSLNEALNDTLRIFSHYSHLHFIHKAIQDGVNLMGYFAWTIEDNFEWNSGYTSRFGFYYVDFKNGRKRYPKLSSRWLANFLKKKSLIIPASYASKKLAIILWQN